MVSDKPPRRSKSDKSPVTIDLAAEDVSTLATPVRSDDSDVPVAAAKTDAEAAVASKPVSAKQDTVTSTATTAKQADTKAADARPTAPVSTPTDKVETSKPGETPKTATSGGPGTSAPASTPSPTAAASSVSSATTSANNSASYDKAGDPTNTGAPKTFGSSTASASSTTGTTSTAANPDPKPATASTATPSATKASTRQAPATSSLIAAGIFGGIVALILTGSMFYAGVIPGGNRTETAALQQQIDSLNQQLASSTSAIEALKTAATAGTGNVGTEIAERLAALEARIAEAGSNTAASDALTQRLAALESKVDQPGREEAVAKALAASALKTAIDRGGSFTGELQTFAGISGSDPAVQTLEKFAQSGVPSASDLVQKFPQTATTILNAAHQMDEQAGIGSRLISSAMQMVKVRPVGDVEGDTPEAIVARMEDKLRKGDLKAASTEWDALPQSAKDASLAYKQTLDARIQVDGLVDNTLNRAISGASNAG